MSSTSNASNEIDGETTNMKTNKIDENTNESAAGDVNEKVWKFYIILLYSKF